MNQIANIQIYFYVEQNKYESILGWFTNILKLSGFQNIFNLSDKDLNQMINDSTSNKEKILFWFKDKVDMEKSCNLFINIEIYEIYLFEINPFFIYYNSSNKQLKKNFITDINSIEKSINIDKQTFINLLRTIQTNNICSIYSQRTLLSFISANLFSNRLHKLEQFDCCILDYNNNRTLNWSNCN